LLLLPLFCVEAQHFVACHASLHWLAVASAGLPSFGLRRFVWQAQHLVPFWAGLDVASVRLAALCVCFARQAPHCVPVYLEPERQSCCKFLSAFVKLVM
jgi:hypothetical protein